MEREGLLAVDIAMHPFPFLTYSVPTSAKGEHTVSAGCLPGPSCEILCGSRLLALPRALGAAGELRVPAVTTRGLDSFPAFQLFSLL